MKKLIAAVILTVVSLTVLATGLFAAGYPTPTGFVNDFANILSQETKNQLDATLTDFSTQTGYEIAVATLDSLNNDTIENVAVELFEQWGIGKKDKDNGILLLIAPNERQLRIEVGYGAEAVLTDSRAGNIIRTVITPLFKQNDYDNGVIKGVEAIKAVLTSDPTAYDETPTDTDSNLKRSFDTFVFVAILLIYLSAFLARSKRWWPGGVLGAILGFFAAAAAGAVVLGLLGLLLDYFLSKNYKKRKTLGLPTSFFRSMGGFSSGSHSSGGGFGGFGGGSSGGGGASGSW